MTRKEPMLKGDQKQHCKREKKLREMNKSIRLHNLLTTHARKYDITAAGWQNCQPHYDQNCTRRGPCSNLGNNCNTTISKTLGINTNQLKNCW